ncbi:hypothetical protein PIB30_089766 [Stylosanthes scabra]|uniref:Uncharacterized protein n=1 Tax=Stylosanthes scabra TaxID=79078 RepID=A0ABU6WXF2_9FABA|nr:hypothetical protein [Stylosanthes scabra]
MATCLIRATHMRRSPRICVDSHSAHVHGHVATTLNVTMTHLPTYRRITSMHMRGRHIASMSSQSCSNMARSPEDPRICVEDSTHMRGRKASSQRFQGHAHASKQGICVEEEFSPVQDKMTHA